MNYYKTVKMGFLFSVGVTGLFSSCNSDDVGGNLYTFTDKTMGQYLRSKPDEYSEFTRLLDTTRVISLLNTAGSYTCFAPDNEAMKSFYLNKGKNDLSDFSYDSLKIIAYDHVINGSVVMFADFVEGRLPQLSMSDRYFSISYDTTGDTYVNKTSRIIQKDITVHNGVIYKISEALNPTRDGIVDAISKDSTFSLFYQALLQTGLADSLLLDKDDTYDASQFESLITVTKDDGQWFYNDIPKYRKYGYTVLMESNATLRENGITDIASMKTYAASMYNQLYPEDADISEVMNRKNSLNRFIAYHLIDKQLSLTKFIDAYDTDHMVKTRDMYEYIETMCPNTLIEVKKERLTNKSNIFNKLLKTGNAIHIVETNYDNDAINGVYHEIDGMLVYEKTLDDELSSKRLRFDAACFFPELTNNNMRGMGNTLPNIHFKLPRNYIKRITCSEQTVVGYLTPYYKYQDYEGDEIFLSSTSGKLYDFSIITPPIPAGTYEVRFGYLTNGKRGVAQLYFDNIPAGVPLNLNNAANDVSIGYIAPHTEPDDYEGYLNDKMMRNSGYMKGPACYMVPTTGWSYGENSRYSIQVLRKIMGTYTFRTAGNHVLMVKGLSGGEFMFDYLEFVPTSALESEDIY